MNPTVREYLLKKKQERDMLDQNSNPSPMQGIGGALAGIGAGFMGRDPLAAMQSVQGQQQQAKKSQLDAFDKSNDMELKGMEMDRSIGIEDEKLGWQRDEQKIKQDKSLREKDPNSMETQLSRQLGQKMLPGYDFSKMNAYEINQRLPELEKIYQIEQKKLDRQDARSDRQQVKDLALSTPFGMANTADDAKQLKGGIESKSNFDSKLDEMIKLREKHGGGALMDREDVARGKQLSKDLLLEYKNMAKLGVLSQTDENIINAIIPKDPLEYNSPLAAIQGQDPILSNLRKFKADSDKDFSTKIATRTQSGMKNPALKNTIGQGSGKITVSNGAETREIDAQDLEEAINDGFKKV